MGDGNELRRRRSVFGLAVIALREVQNCTFDGGLSLSEIEQVLNGAEDGDVRVQDRPSEIKR
jgi:hypothetical protein